MHHSFELARIVSIPFEENSYVARIDGRSDCLVIDPGFEPDKIITHLDAKKLTPAAILNTHGHTDHIAGNAAMKQRWPDSPLVIGADEAAKLTDPYLNLSAAFGQVFISPTADITLVDKDIYSAGGFELEVLAIPGHSSGHLIYLWRAHEPPIAFVGDVIFAGSIGRTDFPDGNHSALIEGIRKMLFTLPEQTILLPGHGPRTTVGEEKRTNPFLQ